MRLTAAMMVGMRLKTLATLTSLLATCEFAIAVTVPLPRPRPKPAALGSSQFRTDGSFGTIPVSSGSYC